MENLLQIKNITHFYGAFKALSDVSLTITKGEITALIGPNGAGKTTFYNVITGKYKPTNGTIYFKGENITGVKTHKLFFKGIGRSFQILNIFPNLTVAENMTIPLIFAKKKAYNLFYNYKNDRMIKKDLDRTFDLLGISKIKDRKVGSLSYGEKRLIEIGIALVSSPELILLDEPTAGMNPAETQGMIQLILKLAQETGTTFFLTEHDMKVVFTVAKKIYVLHQGSIIASGNPEEIKTNTRVKEAYLGKKDYA